MGDGPGTGESQSTYRRIGEMPWRGDEPESVPKRYGAYGEPLNALDARHEILYPDMPARTLPKTTEVDKPVAPEPNYSEQFHDPGSYDRLKVLPEQPISTPTMLRGNFPTAAEVHAESGRFWNNNIDLAQLAWNGYKLYPHAPYPKLPKMFPLWPLDWGHTYSNWVNLNDKKLMAPVHQKFGPAAIGGAAFLAEVGIDAVTGLDKNESQLFRIGADIFGPSIALSQSALLNTWWKKGLCLVGTHTLGRLADKYTETPLRKWSRPVNDL